MVLYRLAVVLSYFFSLGLLQIPYRIFALDTFLRQKKSGSVVLSRVS